MIRGQNEIGGRMNLGGPKNELRGQKWIWGGRMLGAEMNFLRDRSVGF